MKKVSFKIGQQVRIVRGPFKDKVGEVLGFEDDDLIVQFGALKVRIAAALLVADPPAEQRLQSSHSRPRKKRP